MTNGCWAPQLCDCACLAELSSTGTSRHGAPRCLSQGRVPSGLFPGSSKDLGGTRHGLAATPRGLHGDLALGPAVTVTEPAAHRGSFPRDPGYKPPRIHASGTRHDSPGTRLPSSRRCKIQKLDFHSGGDVSTDTGTSEDFQEWRACVFLGVNLPPSGCMCLPAATDTQATSCSFYASGYY